MTSLFEEAPELKMIFLAFWSFCESKFYSKNPMRYKSTPRRRRAVGLMVC
jgi:hypothetical protein